jgi:hypothetical protein
MGKGNEEALDHWATETAGGEAHFAWGTPGDFDRCVVFHEGKGLSPDVAKGHCANLHHRALGVWPGREHKKGEESTMDTAHGYVPILKYDKQADGSLIVEGIATDSGIDRDQQVCDPGWLDTAMPAWFKSGGNIREQHDPKRAAGVAIQYTSKAEGHHIRARVIDPVTVAKVEGKVLKGFSFGARNGRVVVDKAAAGGRIVGGDIYEVSLVDRPANPRCTLTIAKADGAGDLQVVDEPELVEKTDDEPRFTPTQFAELLKGLGKTNPFTTIQEAAPVPKIELADGTKAAGTEKAPEADTTKTEQPAEFGEKKPADDKPTEKPAGTEEDDEDDPADGDEGDTAVSKADVVSKTEVASMVQDAITKAVQPYEERLKALGAELAEVKATPIPGGPARTRTTSQTAITQKADGLRVQAAELQKAVGVSSGVLQQGYQERLRDVEAELRALEGSTTS